MTQVTAILTTMILFIRRRRYTVMALTVMGLRLYIRHRRSMYRLRCCNSTIAHGAGITGMMAEDTRRVVDAGTVFRFQEAMVVDMDLARAVFTAIIENRSPGS